jgi:hypothetical protein
MVHDAYLKRGQRGYLFTIGDEEVPADLSESQLVKVFGQGSAIKNDILLTAISTQWNVFHIMVEQGSHMRYARDKVIKSWTDLLGQRAIPLSDINSLSEVIVSTIEMNEGKDQDAVIKSWDGNTQMVVAKALREFNPILPKTNFSSGVVRF